MPPDHRHAEHRCAAPGCGAWGAFGFAPDPMLPERDRVMRWYCGEHRAIGAAELARWKARSEEPTTTAAPTAERDRPAPPAKPGQGRLL